MWLAAAHTDQWKSLTPLCSGKKGQVVGRTARQRGRGTGECPGRKEDRWNGEGGAMTDISHVCWCPNSVPLPICKIADSDTERRAPDDTLPLDARHTLLVQLHWWGGFSWNWDVVVPKVCSFFQIFHYFINERGCNPIHAFLGVNPIAQNGT